MSRYDPELPELLPTLSRGKHRSPRKGACFMELAGFLAGERWSDHPACTHPLLARLARGVNDVTSDDARPRLAPLIPSVIGLTSTDPLWDHTVGAWGLDMAALILLGVVCGFFVARFLRRHEPEVMRK